jgi:hypothetical protein
VLPGDYFFEFFGDSSPATAGKLLNELFRSRIRAFLFFRILRRQLTHKRPGDFGGLVVVIVDEEPEARFFVELYSHWFCVARNLIRFSNRAVWFEKGKAIFKTHLESVFPGEIFRAQDTNHLRGSKWRFKVEAVSQASFASEFFNNL